MPHSPALLDEALTAWAYARRSVIEEAENLPADQWDFRPTQENRSVAELVRHIIESGRMMDGELPRPDGDFRRQSFDDFVRKYAPEIAGIDTRDELLERLRSTHEEGERRLRDAGEAHMLRPIHQFDGTEAARLTWMHHGISHEEYHRGQLALYAHLLGQVPVLTQKIRGER